MNHYNFSDKQKVIDMMGKGYRLFTGKVPALFDIDGYYKDRLNYIVKPTVAYEIANDKMLSKWQGQIGDVDFFSLVK